MKHLIEIEVSKLKLNPNNPRIIKDGNFKNLVKSIKDFPEMLRARPIVVNPNMVVIGGNMRLKAVQELKIKKTWIYVADWDEAKNNEFIIKDNLSFGEWNWDSLSNDWNTDELEEWGLDVPIIDERTKSNKVILKPFSKVHVLLSFHPDQFDQIKTILSELMTIDGIEYEQTAN